MKSLFTKKNVFLIVWTISSLSYGFGNQKFLEAAESLLAGVFIYLCWDWLGTKINSYNENSSKNTEPDFKQGNHTAFTSETSLVKEYFHQYKNGANALFTVDAEILKAEGWEPRTQLWSSGQFKWYHSLEWMRLSKPPSGTLTVTFEKKAKKYRT